MELQQRMHNCPLDPLGDSRQESGVQLHRAFTVQEVLEGRCWAAANQAGPKADTRSKEQSCMQWISWINNAFSIYNFCCCSHNNKM